ncbi:MAG: hypothetical protein ACRESW_05755, partial [Nevskiales bacterium]
MYKGKYGYAPSCNACHKDGGGSPVNPYGDSFKKAKMNAAAFDAIAAQDSDGDGFANGDEAKAQANPGSVKSTPKAKGDWLDTANLIPKEVQKAYPGVTSYKPLDAVLTAKETERAKAMGVTVSAKDENTIYVPIRDGKPAGTAIIVPGEFKGKLFFLLVATDPKLGITQVSPVNTRNVPEAAKSKAYAGFAGVNAAQVPAAKDAGSVDGAITAAVKK